VLVSTHGEVKLGDFGIALARGRTRWTGPLRVKGKLGYLSPEQILCEELDVRSDLFAVGIVLYELMARRRPWDPIRGVRDLPRVALSPPVPLRARCPGVDARLAAVVERMLDRWPSRRFDGPDDALRALAPFGAGELGSLRLASLVVRARAELEASRGSR
jgi:serine/threonine-protein kinase